MSPTTDTTRSPTSVVATATRRASSALARHRRARTPRPRTGSGPRATARPLNPAEESKSVSDPLEVRHRIETMYSKWGFWSIPPARPARALPLVGALHAAPPGHRRRQDRDPRAAPARRRVLHAPRPLRRRPALASRRRAMIADVSARLRPRHRRRLRPPEHPAALDPHRGRARDLPPRRGGGPVHHRGVRRRRRA